MTKHIHIHLHHTNDAGFDESKVKRNHGQFATTSGTTPQQKPGAPGKSAPAKTGAPAATKKHSLIDVLNDKEGKEMVANLEDLRSSLDGKENDKILQDMYANAKAEFKARWGFGYHD